MVLKTNNKLSWAALIGCLGLVIGGGTVNLNCCYGQSESPSTFATDQEKLKFIRQTMENGEPRSLQTAITRFENADGVTVDLIGVVHIGAAEYYEVLNELFTDYDVVLYELVAPEGHNVPQPGQRSSNPLSFLQASAQNMLNLSSQLDGVDYTQSNFVHADLSPSQMQEKLAERGETAMSLAFDAFAEIMNQQQTSPPEGFDDEMSFSELLDTFNSPYKLRRMMASQFAGEDLELGLGQSLGRLLIDDRNEAAMEVFNSSLRDGHKKLAIFYGAAHMPDFQERLESNNGFKFRSQSWLEAWDLRKSATERTESPFSPLMKLLDEFDR